MGSFRMKFMILCLLLSSVVASAQEYEWKSVPMDGSRTGCIASSVDDVEEALGRIDRRGRYVSPSGRKYSRNTSVAKVASVVLQAQPKMASVKRTIAVSEEEMPNGGSESRLSNWFVDIIRNKVAELSGKKVDVAICNFGGIRIGMPKGNVMLDDIRSMFPFKNYLVYLELKGSQLRKIFDDMAATTFQAIGGARIDVEGKTVKSVSIDGTPLEDDAIYGVATISFLLYGGDGLRLADNAISIVPYDALVSDVVLEHIVALSAEGKNIKGSDVTYVTIR
jgi:2',3'-cyclic-nucleotide 2'-phosphodiesterase (5'-nucleotidase family)